MGPTKKGSAGGPWAQQEKAQRAGPGLNKERLSGRAYRERLTGKDLHLAPIPPQHARRTTCPRPAPNRPRTPCLGHLAPQAFWYRCACPRREFRCDKLKQNQMQLLKRNSSFQTTNKYQSLNMSPSFLLRVHNPSAETEIKFLQITVNTNVNQTDNRI